MAVSGISQYALSPSSSLVVIRLLRAAASTANSVLADRSSPRSDSFRSEGSPWITLWMAAATSAVPNGSSAIQRVLERRAGSEYWTEDTVAAVGTVVVEETPSLELPRDRRI